MSLHFRDLDSIVLYAHALCERAVTHHDFWYARGFIAHYDIAFEYCHWFYTGELPSAYYLTSSEDEDEEESFSELLHGEDDFQDTYDF